MRLLETYRFARRNLARITLVLVGKRERTSLRYWKNGDTAHLANMKAKLPERSKQCAAARQTIFMAMAKHHRTFTLREIGALLRMYWLTQKRTRIVSRLLRELAPAPLPIAA